MPDGHDWDPAACPYLELSPFRGSLYTTLFIWDSRHCGLYGGRRSSVAERWQLKPEALGSTPGGATFLSCPMPFQRSTDSDGPDCVFQLDTITIGLRTIKKSRPSDSSSSCDYTCDLSYIIYIFV